MPDHTSQISLSDQEIGQRVRQCRILRGVSQAKLGSETGVTFQQIQKYESGKNRITVSKLFAIAKALQLDARQILYPDEALMKKMNESGGPLMARPTRKTEANHEMVSALLRYFNAIPNDEMRGEVITHAKRLASLKECQD